MEQPRQEEQELAVASAKKSDVIAGQGSNDESVASADPSRVEATPGSGSVATASNPGSKPVAISVPSAAPAASSPSQQTPASRSSSAGSKRSSVSRPQSASTVAAGADDDDTDDQGEEEAVDEADQKETGPLGQVEGNSDGGTARTHVEIPPDHPALLDIEKLHALYEKQLKEGKPMAAIQCLEAVLMLYVELYGEDSIEVWRQAESLVTTYNSWSMQLLDEEQHDASKELLNKADIVTQKNSIITNQRLRLKLRAITLNNMGCYYKRLGKLHGALDCLNRALKIELHSRETHNPASTHLNLCAVLSMLGKHEPALKHAECALLILEDEMAQNTEAEEEARARGDHEAAVDPNANLQHLVAIACYNIGVQHEFLRQLGPACEVYKRALDIAESCMGADHPMVQTFYVAYEKAETARQTSLEKRERFLAARASAYPKTPRQKLAAMFPNPPRYRPSTSTV